MTTLVFIVWLILGASYIFLASVHIHRTSISRYELEKSKDSRLLRREHLIGGVALTISVLQSLTLIILAYVSAQLWSTWGLMVAIVVVLLAIVVRRLGFIKKKVHNLYEKYEPRLLRFVESVALLRWLGKNFLDEPQDLAIESAEHLLHLVSSAGHVLSVDQQDLIRRGLGWHSKEVKKVMTSVEDIVTVRRTELMGPLVLDDLHKTGHTRFPVVTTSINNVVGQVNIAHLLEVDGSKKSPTAQSIMTPLDVRLHGDTALPEALRQLIDHPSELGLIIDDEGKTIGLVTFSDIISALIGKNRGGVIQ